MSDPDNIPETPEESVKQAETMDNSLLTESQDFHLVDCGETVPETLEESSTIFDCKDGDDRSDDKLQEEKAIFKEIAKETKLCAEEKNVSGDGDVEKNMGIDEKEETHEISQSENREDLENEKNENKDNLETEKNGNNEDKKTCDTEERKKTTYADDIDEEDDNDFVQSSQVESLLPLKKQSSIFFGGQSQKRKAESPSEPLSKFPRTCSGEDALSSVRKELNDEEDNEQVFQSDKAEKSCLDEIETIIADSQETCEFEEKREEKVEPVDRELELLEETLSQHPVEEDVAKTMAKDDESSKPEESRQEKMIVENETPIEQTEQSKAPKEEPEIVDSTTQEPRILEEIEESPKIMKSPEKIVDEASEIPAPTSNDDTKEKSPEEKPQSVLDSEKVDSQKPEITVTSTSRSRMSIEVIYDRTTAPPEKRKPRELVEIDEDGEKIVLDSSQEASDKSMEKSLDACKIIDTTYKTCSSTDYKSIDSSSKDSSNDNKSGLTNGSTESKINNSDLTLSLNDKSLQSPLKKMRTMKIGDNPEVLSVSDSDESFMHEERGKTKEIPTSTSPENSTSKISIEKELTILVKLKCLVSIDETTKEQIEKIVTGVHCENPGVDLSTSRRRHSDNSASLADISGNDKDASPGSVTSIPHPYPLNARLSIASMASTSSSSSAGSLNAKYANIKFQLPRVPAKHAKKNVVDAGATSANAEKRQEVDNEIFEQMRKEWKNIDAVTCSIMSFANQELANMDLHNGSSERTADNSIERIRSSTPEVKPEAPIRQEVTPKRAAGKRSRPVKVTRSKSLRSSEANGKASPLPAIVPPPEMETRRSASKKRKSTPEYSPSTPRQSIVKDTMNETNEDDRLVGKEVFAKWSDNKYYPGTVTGKTKTKFRVGFYDGQNKMVIEDFIVPMPATLNPGLSVYATSEKDDYGSCGIILEVKKIRDNVVYVVETDDQEKIQVNIKDIFLTTDQVQVLKDEIKIEMKTPPSTPKHLGKVSLDNVVDGKRRSKRALTPVTTPRGKRSRASDKNLDSKPSSSGISTGQKFENNYGMTSDDSSGITDTNDDLMGIQEEIIGTNRSEYEDVKGPPSGIKGKARNRKKVESPEIIEKLGPLAPENTELFRGMSFILTCASVETIERYQEDSKDEEKDSNSDPGTENEEEWSRLPFVRDRLIAQLTAGGGKVYDNFESIPLDEYERTKHITNVPNTTKNSLLCLSVGIKPHNHRWVIRCCKENKIVNPAEEELPAGWSILKKFYVEMFQRRNEKPFKTLPVIIVIPVTPSNTEFVKFWRQICENAGGSVILPENPDDGFIEGTVVLTNRNCPLWVVDQASSWNIPLVSTTWIIECLIEGNLCSDDAHPSFKYNHVKRSSHISQLKRR